MAWNIGASQVGGAIGAGQAPADYSSLKAEWVIGTPTLINDEYEWILGGPFVEIDNTGSSSSSSSSSSSRSSSSSSSRSSSSSSSRSSSSSSSSSLSSSSSSSRSSSSSSSSAVLSSSSSSSRSSSSSSSLSSSSSSSRSSSSSSSRSSSSSSSRSSSSSSSLSSSSSSSRSSSSSSSSSSLSSSSSSSSLSSSSSSSQSSSSSSSSAMLLKIYSRGDEPILPADNDNDLETGFSTQDYADVAVDDGTRVSQGAVGEFSIFLFKEASLVGQDTIGVHWNGQTNIAPSQSTVYLQVFNRITTTWETIASNNSATPGVDFDLNGIVTTNLSNYYDVNDRVSARLYQEAV